MARYTSQQKTRTSPPARTEAATKPQSDSGVQRRAGASAMHTASSTHVSPDQIRIRAYEIYLSRRSGTGGDAISDWAQAERELNSLKH